MAEPATDAEIEKLRYLASAPLSQDSTVPPTFTRDCMARVLARLDAERAANAQLRAAVAEERERCARTAETWMLGGSSIGSAIAAAIRASKA